VPADDVDRQRVTAGRQPGGAEEHRLISLLKTGARIDLRDEHSVDRDVGETGAEAALADPAH
jgi:hypothetical protein